MTDQFAEHLKQSVPERRDPESREQVLANIHRQFREMAGLSLTMAQAVRLFGCEDANRCARILDEAINRGLLKVNESGLLVRGDR